MIKTKKAFTLLELIVVITIIWFLMMMAYAPYNYFQKKAELKIGAKNIEKTLLQARNKAIYWANSSSWNLSIWVYFEKDLNKLKIFNYPYNYWTWAKIVINDNKLLKKEVSLWKNIFIRKIAWKNKVLFLFEAISWKTYVFDYSFGPKSLITDKVINIDFSYKTAKPSSTLYKTLKYYIKTHISDY